MRVSVLLAQIEVKTRSGGIGKAIVNAAKIVGIRYSVLVTVFSRLSIVESCISTYLPIGAI